MLGSPPLAGPGIPLCPLPRAFLSTSLGVGTPLPAALPAGSRSAGLQPETKANKRHIRGERNSGWTQRLLCCICNSFLLSFLFKRGHLGRSGQQEVCSIPSPAQRPWRWQRRWPWAAAAPVPPSRPSLPFVPAGPRCCLGRRRRGRPRARLAPSPGLVVAAVKPGPDGVRFDKSRGACPSFISLL